MKKLALLIVLVFLHACVAVRGNLQNAEFRSFVRHFFVDEAYQRKHVKFPLEIISYEEGDDDYELVTKYLSSDEWKHMPGPAHYRCETGCYDLIIYDNFERQHSNTGRRVLSFEGVDNGINSSLYFELINGEWFLVRFEQLDT